MCTGQRTRVDPIGFARLLEYAEQGRAGNRLIIRISRVANHRHVWYADSLSSSSGKPMTEKSSSRSGERPTTAAASKVNSDASANSESDLRFSRRREIPSYKIRRTEAENRELRKREINIAEQSANAAKTSSRWAAWAVAVALAALVIAGWQQFAQR